ncbi:MAG: HEAT repeat domain-containing protein [Dehalococcoidia bacterium]
MSNYLVVANQTALSDELSQYVTQLVSSDPNAAFTLLVPATPPAQMETWTADAAELTAQRVARAACAKFEASGAHVVRTAVGDPDALLAIEDELRERPEAYDALVICTLPLGVSRWMRMDVPGRAGATFGLRLVHVTADAAPGLPPWPTGDGLTMPAHYRPGGTLPAIARFLAEALRGTAELPAERAREALVAIGPASVPVLLEALRADDDNVRWEAAKALGQLRAGEAAVALVGALTDRHGGVRWLAAEALAAIGEPAVRPVLRGLLAHSDSPWLREGAHHVLRTLLTTGPGEITPVVRALEGVEPAIGVMTAASDALKAVGSTPVS